MSLLLRNGSVLVAGGMRARTDVHIADGVIARIGPGIEAPGADEIDCAACIVAPGYVDLHIHGAAGVLCESGDTGAIRRISEILPRYGVTAFLPTLAALPPQRLRTAVAAIAAVQGGEPGARILGIHLEGPFLNPTFAGAQRSDWMRAPALAELEELQSLAAGAIRLITVAPELPGAIPFIAAARRLGVTVSIGHTGATAEQMREAIAAGALHVTHLFNAMRPLHHREPGPIGIALADDKVSVELICDGHHLDPTAVALAWRCKPRDKLVLVSDSVALDMPEGSCKLFDSDCVIGGGAIRLAKSGALAGSCLGLDQALRNLRAWLPDAPLEALLASTSANAAATIAETRAGSLVVGAPADLVVLDRNLEIAATLSGGKIIWPGHGKMPLRRGKG